MTWRELWRAAVDNVRALFAPPPEPPPTLRVTRPRALPGPVAPRVLAAPDTPALDTAEPDPLPPPTQPQPAAPRPKPVASSQTRRIAAVEPRTATASMVNVIDVEPPALEPSHAADPVADAPPPAAADDDLMQELLALLEALLFVAGEPVDATQLAQALDVDAATLTALLAQLDAGYRTPGRGLRLQQLGGKVQLVSAPEAAAVIERFLNLDPRTRLSAPALETLAVIAYRQPVTRVQIEAVRGVDCAGVLRSLSQRGLVTEVGRQESVGRPILYGVTELFMQHFGLLGLGDLPPLEETDADRLHATLDQHDDLNDPR